MSAAPATWVPERREVIWIDHNPQAGKEMKDEHPMLVISPKAFNLKTGIVIGFPMTSSEGNADNPFAVPVTIKGKTGYILAHQPKSFDWRERQARPVTKGQVTMGDQQALAQALELLDSICGVCPT